MLNLMVHKVTTDHSRSTDTGNPHVYELWDKSRYDTKNISSLCRFVLPVPVAARSKAKVYGLLPAAIAGSNPTGSKDVCLFCVLCVVT
jgi:hypothetical protein